MPKDENKHRRVVVEEVSAPEEIAEAPLESEKLETISEVKEKVEELQDLTKDISQTVEKSENLEQEIVEEVENIEEPLIPVSPPPASNDTFPEIRTSGTNPLIILIPGLFLLGALLGGIYFYQKGIGVKPSATVAPTEITVVNDNATPVASATPAAALVLSKYLINIKNGSGTPGEAGKVKDILSTGGFSVSGTGNAASYDFTKTVIKAKNDVPAAFVSQLSTLLGKTYVLDTNQTLATSSADSVQVIVGSTKVK